MGLHNSTPQFDATYLSVRVAVATTAAHAEDVKADSTKGKRRVKLPMFGQLRI